MVLELQINHQVLCFIVNFFKFLVFNDFLLKRVFLKMTFFKLAGRLTLAVIY